MQLVNYTPLSDLLGAEREMDKWFSSGWPVLSLHENSAVDMYTEGSKLVTEVVLPNFTKEEVKVSASSESLEITAEHKEKEEENSKRNYLLRESSRSYRRRISLPPGAATGKIAASFEGGKLTVTMPFEREKETRQIAIA